MVLDTLNIEHQYYSNEKQGHFHLPGRREAGRSGGLFDDAQTRGLDLQPRLPLLLLSG